MIHNYSSHEAIESGECSNADCPEVLVLSDPSAGSQITVPSYVTIRLYTENPDATIRYTIDGTEPDDLSARYTAPILISSVGLGIRARAFLPGCTPGPILNLAFSNPQFPFVFSYACDTPDKGGKWDVWAPSGRNDHHWVLQFTLTGATTIKRLELYQLDAAGKWTTGQVWSTDSPINPFPDNPDTDFASFPLLLFIAAVQQHVSYQSSLGSFGAGTHTWDLYGDIEVATGTGHLFRLDIILANDTKLSQIISNTCTVTPPICAPPATPTATGKCGGKADVTFTGTAGRPYRIYHRSLSCSEEAWVLGSNGTIDASPKTVEISGLTKGCPYDFYVSIDEAGCGFKDSNTVTVIVPADALVSIATDKTIVDPNESFTISWTSQYIQTAVCGGCLAGEVSINQGIGCKPGNLNANQSVSQAVCGIYVYQITGCNSCGTVVASVSVEVRCGATCAAPHPPCVKISGWRVGDDDLLTPYVGEVVCGLQNSTFSDAGVWAGVFLEGGNPCLRIIGPGNGTIVGTFRCYEGSPSICGYELNGAEVGFYPAPAPARWKLTISARSYASGGGGVSVLLWEGEKLYGSNPTGVFSKTAGCATGPATLSVTDQSCPS